MSRQVPFHVLQDASMDGYVSPEPNALLNKVWLNGGLTDSEQLRLYQLLQAQDGL
jgi:hypothetical protein